MRQRDLSEDFEPPLAFDGLTLAEQTIRPVRRNGPSVLAMLSD